MSALIASLKKNWEIQLLLLTDSVLLSSQEMPDCPMLIPKQKSLPSKIWWIHKQIRSFNPDIVHSFDIESGIYVSLVSSVWRKSYKHISGYGASTLDDKRLLFLLSRKKLQPDLFICNSQIGAEFLKKINRSYTPVKVIHNGLHATVSGFTSGNILANLPPDAPLIGYIGKFDHIKHAERMVDVALRLLEHPQKPYVIIIGDGPFRKDALARVSQLSEDFKARIWLPGEIPDASTLISRFTIGTLVSDAEGFPNVILEYMRAGVPWVSTKVGDIESINTSGSCGLILEAWDENAFVSALKELLENPSKRNALGQTGKAVFSERFTVDKMAARFEDEYCLLLN